MSAFMIVHATITDKERYQKYRDAVVPLIAQFGGKHVVRGGTVVLLEGHHDGRRMAMFEFPDIEAVNAFWNSPQYLPVKELRRGAATLDVWAVSGA